MRVKRKNSATQKIVSRYKAIAFWNWFNNYHQQKNTVSGKEEVELGYALMPEFWGKELAVEIGKKALSIAFDDFNYPSVVCYTLVDNKRSERVMQKIGFSFEREITHANYPHVLYRYQNPKL